MNFPQKTDGNWLWRVLPDQFTSDLAQHLAHLNWFYAREPA